MPDPGRARARVLVAGAGAAGLAAAISAARAGAEVTLLDARARPGGTVTHALLHTLGGFFDGAGELLADGIARELVERLQAASPRAERRRIGRVFTLAVPPRIYEDVIATWLAEEKCLFTHLGATVIGATRDGDAIARIDWRDEAGATRAFRPTAVVDCTGGAAIARLVDPALVDDAGPRAAGGLIAILSGVSAGALAFPAGVKAARAMQEAAATGALPSACAELAMDAGDLGADEACLKFAIRGEDETRREMNAASARAALPAAIEFLRRELPAFSGAALSRVGALGVRDGGGAVGDYRLTAADVRSGRRFPDAVGLCSWPIEYWRPEGGVLFEYLPKGAAYAIPLRALAVQGLKNLWVAGRGLSAEPLARASARVVGACWAMGQGAGAAAASLGLSATRNASAARP